MKHHLFRTNNLSFSMKISPIHFRAHRHLSLHQGNKQNSIQMLHFYIAVLVAAAPLSCLFWGGKFTDPGFSTLGSWVIFFASFQIQVFPLETCFTFTRVNPYSLRILKRFFFRFPASWCKLTCYKGACKICTSSE